MDEGIADFVTLDMLNEQLAVVDHYLATTPNTPFTANRRHKLMEEQEQLLALIQRKQMQGEEQQHESHSSSSPSQSLSPVPTPQPALSNSNSASVSGFSTPDLWSSSREHNPFAFAAEEPFFPDDDRLAQELADFELAQQLAQQFTDNEEIERQRRIQIEADEEFARQVEAAMSPVQQQSHRFGSAQDTDSPQMDSDHIFTPGHNPTMPDPLSTFNTYNSLQLSPPQASTSSSTSFSIPSYKVSSSADLTCPKCLLQRSPADRSCWRCLTRFTTPAASDVSTPEPFEMQDVWPPRDTSAMRVKQEPDVETHTPLQQHNSVFSQHPQTSYLLGFQQPLPQQQQQQSNSPYHQMQRLQQHQQYLHQIREAHRLQRQQMAMSYTPFGTGIGTSSNPISLDDSPPQTRTLQSNTHIPNFSLPQSMAALNNGWPVNLTNPFSSQSTTNDPALYLTRIPHDYPVPNPSADEIKELLANIRPDEDIKVEDKDAIIPGLAPQMRLMKHQQMGLAWMQKMEEGKNKGGLLADEMGLGKTIQSIALLVSRPSDDDDCRTTLICTPVALLRQWFNEIRTKTQPSLNVYIHHASSRGKKAKSTAELMKYDVVLTTFTTIALEWKAYDRFRNDEDADPSAKPTNLFLDAQWYRIILDESQVIKNRNTQTARGACCLKSTYRWSLSGTPMQNGVEEMYSQLAFLRIRPYSEWKAFHATFVMGFKRARQRKDAMRKFQAVLKAILLRRTKTSKIDGVEILKGLPGKTVEMVHAVFDEEQLEFYKGLETGAITQMRKYQAAGTLGRNFGNALVLLLRLRQACLHPRLIKEIKKAGSTELTADQQVALAKEFNEQTVMRIKEIATFECPICLDTVLNPSLVLPCGHHYCTECLASMFDQEREDALARGEEARDKTKCPGCRGDMDQRRMVSLESFKAAHCQEKGDDIDLDSYNGSASEAEEDNDWLFADDRKRKGKGKEPAAKSRKKTKPVLDPEEDWISSAKVDKLCEILEAVRARDPSEKVIVFSQFTGFLDIIGPALEDRNFKYGRYDGSMSGRHREEELESFRVDPTKTVCLVSLRAGAYGLNLTCASQCVILDPFWNPFVEAQAIDRIHRIGQSKPVEVHRIVIAETVEDRILALQEKEKRDIIEGALAEDASKAIARLSAKDLLFLFGIGG